MKSNIIPIWYTKNKDYGVYKCNYCGRTELDPHRISHAPDCKLTGGKQYFRYRLSKCTNRNQDEKDRTKYKKENRKRAKYSKRDIHCLACQIEGRQGDGQR